MRTKYLKVRLTEEEHENLVAQYKIYRDWIELPELNLSHYVRMLIKDAVKRHPSKRVKASIKGEEK